MSGFFQIADDVHPCCMCTKRSWLFMPASCPAVRCGTLAYPFPVDELFVLFPFLLLQMMLLWTFPYTSLCGHVFSFLGGRYLGVEWLGHVVSSCLPFLKKLPNRFLKWLYHFTGSSFSISLSILGVICPLDWIHPSGCIVVSHHAFSLHFLSN